MTYCQNCIRPVQGTVWNKINGVGTVAATWDKADQWYATWKKDENPWAPVAWDKGEIPWAASWDKSGAGWFTAQPGLTAGYLASWSKEVPTWYSSWSKVQRW